MKAKGHQPLLRSHFIFFLPFSHSLQTRSCFSFSAKCCMGKKRPDCHCIEHKFMELGSKEDSPLAEAENCYTSLHRQIILSGVRRTVTEARSQLHSLTGAIKWLMVQNQGRISTVYCISYTFFHASRTMNITLKEQCSHMLSLNRTIFKGPKVTWKKNVPHKVNYSKNLLKYLQ